MCAALALLCLAGCPTAERDLSGTYVEVNPASVDEMLVLDVFRFGEHLMVVKRRFRRDLTSGQLGAQIECEWSELAERFDPETGAFSVVLEDTRERVEGTLTAERLDVTLTPERQEAGPTRALRLASEAPDNACTRISDFFFKFDFSLPQGASNTTPDGYAVRQLTFELLWLAVEPQEREGFIQWIGLNDRAPTVPLTESAHYTLGSDSTATLQRAHPLSIPPPPDRVLVRSGATRYALAHFVVIDHRDGFEPGNTWSLPDEPILATSLELGLRADSPPNTIGVGKALLFVEGDLTQLGAVLQARIRNLDAYREIATGRHFYIVDVFFDEDSIIELALPDDPTRDLLNNDVRLRTTSRFIGQSAITLPRLFPL